MIKFRCPHCVQKLGVPDNYANHRIRCSKCNQPSRVPAAPAISTPQQSHQSTQSAGVSQTQKVMSREELLGQDKQDSVKIELQTPPAPAPAPEINPFAGLEDVDTIEESPNRQALRQARQLQRQKTRASSTPSRSAKVRKEKGESTSGGGFSLSGIMDFVPDVLRLPLGLAASVAASGLMIGIWIVASRSTENALGFICLFVPLAGALGLRLFTVERTFFLALIATLIGVAGIGAGKFAIAKYVVIPYLHDQANKEVLIDLPSLLADEKYQLKPGQSAKFVAQDGDFMECVALISLVDDGLADPKVVRKWAKHILLISNKTNIYAHLMSILGSEPERPQPPEIEDKDEAMFELASERLNEWYMEEVELRKARQYFPALNCVASQAETQRLLNKPETAFKLAIFNTLGLFDGLWIFLGLGLAYAAVAMD